MTPDNLAFEELALDATGKSNPKVCFLPTACADAEWAIEAFDAAFSRFPCERSVLSLFNVPARGPVSVLEEQDLFVICGGNTKSLLALWREWRVDCGLVDAYRRGAVMIGSSAGMNCWFQGCVTDSIPGQMSALPGIGLLPASSCPHYDSQPTRRPAFREMVKSGQLPEGYGVDDQAALHFHGETLVECLTTHPDASVYRVSRAAESRLETRLIRQATR